MDPAGALGTRRDQDFLPGGFRKEDAGTAGAAFGCFGLRVSRFDFF
jgi:hypothetical protein